MNNYRWNLFGDSVAKKSYNGAAVGVIGALVGGLFGIGHGIQRNISRKLVSHLECEKTIAVFKGLSQAQQEQVAAKAKERYKNERSFLSNSRSSSQLFEKIEGSSSAKASLILDYLEAKDVEYERGYLTRVEREKSVRDTYQNNGKRMFHIIADEINKANRVSQIELTQ